jgi:hypothetical protein
MKLDLNLESFWADILSEEPAQISNASRHLSKTERQAIIAHLQRMAHEPGWSDGQRRRAQSALDILEDGD